MLKLLLVVLLLLTANSSFASDYFRYNTHSSRNHNYHLGNYNSSGGSHNYRNIRLGQGHGYVSVYNRGEGASRDVGYKTVTSSGNYPTRFKTVIINPNPPLPSGNYSRVGNRNR